MCTSWSQMVYLLHQEVAKHRVRGAVSPSTIRIYDTAWAATMWPQEIQMEKDDAIDSQIKRLEDYLLGNKQIVNAHEVTIEQALALAYIARELRGRQA